ncbi:branched-chain amino acid transporter [Exiguobacterium sp. BMC-KP]|uniref:branched-chain amino acid transport system II carrier protein n=1 Tax=Exiguobacterium sp. BMC-KP TaxID=1684312 RepID=UPI0006AA4F9F|nr:branched-chain amino acid transport system II carrier protein [Exiguobacterium sp. BMC-KP]KOP28877.1 branched-chain amino acid transporter [Exiguobacterium sp. BMC-KP]
MSKTVPTSFIIVIGMMLFALFFGAGNLIFPPMLGQLAGEHVWVANAGFLVTGVGLPLLAILAFAYSGERDLQAMASRVHPIFGIGFSVILYLAIGPFFAIPRAGTVSYEIGIKPFFSESTSHWPLLIFTVLFYTVACLLSLNPTKIVDVVGKVLTPIKITFIGLLIIVAVLHPIGSFQNPLKTYQSNAFFNGFQEGYMTLDALGAFVFGIIIIAAIKEKGVTSKRQLLLICTKASLIAAALLAITYTALAFMGASSVSEIGQLANGAEILSAVSDHYFGEYGAILLGLMITVACMTTSVGLITACASFFSALVPKISYVKWTIGLSVFSALVANIGLNQLLAVSKPVLMTLYPLAICLIFLTFLHPLFKGKPAVYQGALWMTFVVSLFDGLQTAGLNVSVVTKVFNAVLPFASVSLGWVVPAIIGGVIGAIVGNKTAETQSSSRVA